MLLNVPNVPNPFCKENSVEFLRECNGQSYNNTLKLFSGQRVIWDAFRVQTAPIIEKLKAETFVP
jgi:hypothetical protein